MGVQFSTSDSAVPATIHDLNSESVIKIFTASQEPDWTLPYQNLDMSDSRGSGVLISGGRVLTAARTPPIPFHFVSRLIFSPPFPHLAFPLLLDVIAQYTFVEIQKATDPKKVPARVVHVCHDADLALLEPVGHPSFFEGLTEIKVGDMPKRGDRIFVCGYPIGGEEVGLPHSPFFSFGESVVNWLTHPPLSSSSTFSYRLLKVSLVELNCNPTLTHFVTYWPSLSTLVRKQTLQSHSPA